MPGLGLMRIRLTYTVVSMGLEYEKTVSSYEEMSLWIVDMNSMWVVGLDSHVQIEIKRIDLQPV